MSGQRRHAPGIFEGEAARAPQIAPTTRRRRLSAAKLASLALLVVCGAGLVVVLALGLPLALIGGKVALVLPLGALILLVRSGRRR